MPNTAALVDRSTNGLRATAGARLLGNHHPRRGHGNDHRLRVSKKTGADIPLRDKNGAWWA